MKKNIHMIYAGAFVLVGVIISFSYLHIENKKLLLSKQKEIKKQEEKKSRDALREYCLEYARKIYLANWDSACEVNGKSKECSLSLYLADRKNKSYESSREECYKKYPVK